MKPGLKTGGISNHMSGVMLPRPGEGAFICRSCGKHFHNHASSDENWLLDIFRKVTNGNFVKCPECGSLRTERDPFVAY